MGRIITTTASAMVTLVFAAGVATTATADSWVPTGAMTNPLFYNSAVTLGDGRVLVAGGAADAGWVASANAEIYDPASGTWAATGSMGTPRLEYAAVRLVDGRVLVSGGLSGSGIVPSAEIYDPVPGTWSPTGSMGTRRFTHAAVLLRDGRVLVFGGDDGSSMSTRLASAEIYDPALGTWSPTTSMHDSREGATPILLPDGRVFVSGGGQANGQYRASAEIYDPALATWTLTAPMSAPRAFHTPVLLPGGRVLVAGGLTDYVASTLATAEVYDPSVDAWTPAASMSTGRGYHTGVLLADGRVLVAGGTDGVFPPTPWTPLASAEIYDVALDAWGPAAPMGAARAVHTATLLGDGRVLVNTGSALGGVVVPSAELYVASDCGNAAVDVGEDCDVRDPGGAGCCSANCRFEPAARPCRPAAGSCDIGESCDGTSGSCPADSWRAAGTACRASAGVCDPGEVCDGSSAACPEDAFVAIGTECRGSAGACDPAEACTGTSSDCPADALAATVCRGSSGPCDPAESCNGSDLDCPLDTLASADVVCRASIGECDPSEKCPGDSILCPADTVLPWGVPCGSPVTGDCTSPDSCNGAGVCDPNDVPAGSPCDDGDACTVEDACRAGTCIGGGQVVCDDSNPCTQDSCSPGDGTCVFLVEPMVGCRAATNSGLQFTPEGGKARWKWQQGEATDCGDFRAPDFDTVSDICVYDGVGSGEFVLATWFHLPWSAVWEVGASCRWSYLDKATAVDGIRTMTLAPGETGHASIQVKAQGDNVPMPTPVSAERFFTMDPNVTVQFHNGRSLCWESQFTEAFKNTAEKFKTRRKILITQ